MAKTKNVTVSVLSTAGEKVGTVSLKADIWGIEPNTQVVYDELLNLSQEYGVQISDEIIAPWQAGQNAIGEYKDAFTNPELNAATSEFMSQLDSMKSKWEETADAAEDAADRQIAAVKRQQQETVAAYKEMQDSISTITIGNVGNVGSGLSDKAGWSGGGLTGGAGGTGALVHRGGGPAGLHRPAGGIHPPCLFPVPAAPVAAADGVEELGKKLLSPVGKSAIIPLLSKK